MVLNELGARIGAALAQMSNAATIDEKVLDDCLKEISNALVQARSRSCDSGSPAQSQQQEPFLVATLAAKIDLSRMLRPFNRNKARLLSSGVPCMCSYRSRHP